MISYFQILIISFTASVFSVRVSIDKENNDFNSPLKKMITKVQLIVNTSRSNVLTASQDVFDAWSPSPLDYNKKRENTLVITNIRSISGQEESKYKNKYRYFHQTKKVRDLLKRVHQKITLTSLSRKREIINLLCMNICEKRFDACMTVDENPDVITLGAVLRMCKNVQSSCEKRECFTSNNNLKTEDHL